MVQPSEHRYFTEFTLSKAILYSIATVYVFAASIAVMIQPFVAIPCHNTLTGNEPKTENVLYIYNPCRFKRFPHLLL